MLSLRQFPWIAVFCLTGIASAQAIIPDKNQLTFTAPVGGGAVAQPLRVTASSGSLLLSATATTFGTGNWLSVSPGISQTPAAFIVSIDTSQLSQGIYSGAINISAPGATNNPQSVSVSLTVGTPSTAAFAVTPTSLVFNGQSGGFGVNSQTLSVTSTPAGQGFTASASTNDIYNWLQVTPTSSATAPSTLTVLANTAGLPLGTYSGTITITPLIGSAITVPVTLNLGSTATLSSTVSSLQFFYQVGSFLPLQQVFTVSSGSTPVGISVVATTNDGRNWLNATPTSGNTPQSITVTTSPSGLPAGVYTGKIHVSSPASSNVSIDVSVTLTVSTGPLLTVGAAPSPFVYQTGTTPPSAQTVSISSSSGNLNFTATASTSDGAQWLSVIPSGGLTPQNLMIAVNPVSLAPGNYTGNVTVSAAGASNSPLTIPISLTVTNTSALMPSVSSVSLNYQIGGINQVTSQLIRVDTTGQSVTGTASVTPTSCGANWLQVSPTTFSTPAFLRLLVDPIGLNLPQTCTATLSLMQAGASPVLIPITLNVSLNPLFNVTPLSLNFTANFDSDVTAAQTVALSVTDNSAVTYTAIASTNNGVPWLRVTPGSGSTPASLSVTADPNGLSAGVYTGTITVSSPSLTTAQQIPVTFKVTPTASAIVTPAALSFTQAAGGPAPPAQNVTVTSSGSGSLAYQLTVFPGTLGGNALFASPIAGMTPAALTVSVNGSALPAGNYSGSISLTIPAAANNPFTIPVSLTVTPVVSGPAISASPLSLIFSSVPGAATPTQQVTVNATGGAGPVSAAASGGNWLSVNGPSSTGVFTVAVDPTGLASGSYIGSITLTSAGAAGSPISIPVRLNVTAPLGPTLVQVVNAASGMPGVISPGEIVTLTGDTLGPAEGATLRLQQDDTLATGVEGTRVLFDDVAAPILYTSAQQVNAIVPYEVGGRRTVQVTVERNGVRSSALTYQVGAAAPGIFTLTQTGHGQGAILNQDNSYNGASTPAARGSIIQVFMTGEGAVIPAAVTGSITRTPHASVGRVTATIGGAPADVAFAGAAPDAVAGLFQVNLRVPPNVPVGDAPVVITIAGVQSQTGVSVAIR